jgi:RNase P/RNase MRP subunit POP5
MVVKEKRGRRRYIAFRSELGREQMLSALRSKADSIGVRTPKLIQFEGGMGIVRCSPEEKDAIIDLLGSVEGTESLLTSGTLRTLRERYGMERPSG